MRFIIMNIVFVFGNGLCYSQVNLVPNSSFEDTIDCPDSLGELFNAANWINPNTNSPDFFHFCNDNSIWPNVPDVPQNFWGFQNALNGNGYCGIGMTVLGGDSREYISVKLNDTLRQGINYRVAFSLSLADSVKYASADLSVLFHSSLISEIGGLPLAYQPQIVNNPNNFYMDKNSWMNFEHFYIADGTELYLTIGNFNFDSSSNFIETNFLPVNSSNKNISYYYIDDVFVGEYIEPVFEENKLDVFPNPSSESINFSYELKEENAVLRIYNVIGQLVREENLIGNNGTLSLDLFNLAKGMYFATVLQNDKKLLVKKFSIIK